MQKGAPSIKARISSTLQTVVRGPSFIGFGNRPSLTPSRQELLLIGIMARIDESRTKPASGRMHCFIVDTSACFRTEAFIMDEKRRQQKASLNNYRFCETLYCAYRDFFLARMILARLIFLFCATSAMAASCFP